MAELTPQTPSPTTANRARRKPTSRRKPTKKRKKNDTHGKRLAWIIGITLSVITLVAAAFLLGIIGYHGQERWVKIPRGATNEIVHQSLRDSLGTSEGNRVYLLWRIMGSDAQTANGAYLISHGQPAIATARRIHNGAQTPIKVTLPGSRTLKGMAEKLTAPLECTTDEFLDACNTVLTAEGFSKEEFPAAFLPDTYEMYWNAPASKIVKRLLSYRNEFWNDERRSQAEALGLTPSQVATVASIVEEESAKRDERPVIARLYLNRFHRHMKLQADPTVKFATGDFTLRRITGQHLRTPSPYNTYLNEGLPPGPIRVVEKSTLDGVLNAPQHDYIYMCAKEDFSGYHNFATDYATHMANARRYQAELNRRNIH